MSNQVWQVGEFTITKLVEGGGYGPNGGPASGLPDAWPEEILRIPWLLPDFANEQGHLGMSVHALLVQTPTHRLIVDTCIGNNKTRAMPHFDHLTTNFLDELERAAWARESVDAVVCTHLHVDHVGWNTMLVDGKWIPTFPNATYFLVRSEVEHIGAQVQLGGAGLSPYAAAMIDAGNVYGDSVQPILDAGLAKLVDTDAVILPGVRLASTPGHTPGHVSVLLESGGESAVVTGDMMHHPCQIARPHWSSAFDDDPVQSVATRLSFLERFVDTSTLVIGTHFITPTAGHLVRSEDGYVLAV
jgi:glyoxylase-like metal-dependent hydrolase (beta-lactamase superfamily II)